jgi:arsenate reductase
MAEGWARHLEPDRLEPYSAGIAPGELDPRAVRVMGESGVDISSQRSKHLDELAGVRFDRVVTVCENARQRCPLFPGTTPVAHVGFDDPPTLARNAVSDEEALDHYRRVRDEIRAFVASFGESLENEKQGDK